MSAEDMFEGFTEEEIKEAQLKVGCEGCGCGGCDDMVHEELTTAADAGIPTDTANMGPSKMAPLFKRYRTTDNRFKKDKTPRLLKKFKEYKD